MFQVEGLAQHLSSLFWKMWHVDYLKTLQQQQKWTKTNIKCKARDLVLLEDPSPSPLKWPLDIVEQVLPGSEGVCCTNSYNQGIFLMSVIKLCPLPISE